jgi:cobalt-zinc-cadmium efflux system membrane fusion protein
LLLAIIVMGGLAAPFAKHYLFEVKEANEVNEVHSDRFIELVPDHSNQIRVSPETVLGMGLQFQPARVAQSSLPMKLVGQLMLDPHRLIHVHARFGGEVVEIGHVQDDYSPKDSTSSSAAENAEKPTRPLRAGDRVTQGQLLAVLWCKEIGEKKSDLVDALSQLYLHEKILTNLKKIEGSVISQRTLSEMERNYEADVIQVHRVQRTLRSWRIDEEELREVESEALRLHALAVAGPAAVRADVESTRNSKVNPLARWAEVEVRAPISGIILEKNFTVGDIVETTLDLFRIADLSRLGVMVNVFEEDIDRLVSMPTEKRNWKVRLQAIPSAPASSGRFETIGNVIDSNQHTAVVTGWLENPDGRFRVGQFVQAIVEMDTPVDLVEVPISALNDDGPRSTVFVALEPAGTLWERRNVSVARRSALTAWIRTEIADERTENSTDSKSESAEKGLKPGELVLTDGVLELMQSLINLQNESPVTDASVKNVKTAK